MLNKVDPYGDRGRMLSIRDASSRYGRVKETEDRDTCHTPAVGYVSQPHGAKHAIIRRIPIYRDGKPSPTGTLSATRRS